MKLSFKSAIINLLKYLVTFAVIFWIIHSYGWKNIKTSISNAEFGWLFLGFLMFVISIFFGSVQWFLILKNRGVEIKFFKALKIYFTGIFFNNFIFGMIAGDAYKIAALHLNKKGAKPGFAATFLERLSGLVILSFYAIVGGVIIFSTNFQHGKDMLPVLGVLSLFISFFLAFFILLLSKRLQTFSYKLLDKLPPFPAKEMIRGLAEETFLNRHGKDDLKLLLQVGSISFVIQTLRIGVNISAALSIGIFSFSVLHYFFVIIPLIALMMIVPMPFGVRETAGGVLFGLAGFSPQDSVVMLFLATIVSVMASLAGGVFFLLDKINRNEKNT